MAKVLKNTVFRFRDYNSKKELVTYCETSKPAFIACVDRVEKVIFVVKFGDKENLLKLLPKYNYSPLGETVLIEVPKNQTLLDKLFQSSGFFQKYYGQIFFK